MLKSTLKKQLKMQQLLGKQPYKRPLYAGLWSLDLSVSLYSPDRTGQDCQDLFYTHTSGNVAER